MVAAAAAGAAVVVVVVVVVVVAVVVVVVVVVIVKWAVALASSEARDNNNFDQVLDELYQFAESVEPYMPPQTYAVSRSAARQPGCHCFHVRACCVASRVTVSVQSFAHSDSSMPLIA